jgi:anti-anti-sigma factor
VIDVQTTACAAVLTLSGEFDLAVASELCAALEDAVSGEWPTVMVECAQVTFIDISGARPFLAARAAAERSQREFVLRDPAPRVRLVLDFLGLGGSVVAGKG